SATVRAYEKKYGPLDIGVNTAPAAAPAAPAAVKATGKSAK
ncbi:hypothetical protein SAMN05720487_1375, partial [Fibrobacter sp. UWT2]